MSNPGKSRSWSPGHEAGGQVGAGSREIAATRHGVAPADVRMAQSSNQNTGDAQRAAIAASNSGVIQATPADMPNPADR
jgi:hypothetical protein